ncbi:hypothetical protein SNEBB_010567 [Seison nebaliae]|nr:hypothetical protein SNEBB_010567 [Seison nebaliae]
MPKKQVIEKTSVDIGSEIIDGKVKYRIIAQLGEGTFGNVYRAKMMGNISKMIALKVEDHRSGPLFCEMNFYMRIKNSVTRLSEGCANYLPIAKFISGGVDVNRTNIRLRYVALEMYDSDLETFLKNYREKNVNNFVRLVLNWTKNTMSGLEFIHDNKYIHGDIKGENLLISGKEPNKIFISDFGNVERYYDTNSLMKSYKPQKKLKHQGTLQFTSIDAHDGITYSRRGDIETLIFNFIYWLTGNLTWFDVKSKEKVAEEKKRFISSKYINYNYTKFERKHSKNIDLTSDKETLKQIDFSLRNLMKLMKELKFEDVPLYKQFYRILNSAIDSLEKNNMTIKNDNLSETIYYSFCDESLNGNQFNQPLIPNDDDSDEDVIQIIQEQYKKHNIRSGMIGTTTNVTPKRNRTRKCKNEFS